MYIAPEWKKRLWISAAVGVFLLPGWRGELVPVPHEEILLESRNYDADDVIPASRAGAALGERWDATYLGSRWAAFFDLLNLRGLAMRVVPPRYVAHIPPGPDGRPAHADAYFRVETSTQWPWWWPGAGVDWRAP